jgi:hypothetical protein
MLKMPKNSCMHRGRGPKNTLVARRSYDSQKVEEGTGR